MTYEIQYKKIKNMYLRIKNGKIYVTAPIHTPFETIDQFVHSKKQWITQAIQRQNNHFNKYMIHPTQVRIFGEYYQIEQAELFSINDKTIKFINLAQLQKYLRQRLEKYAITKFKTYCHILNQYFDEPTLKFSYLKGKWGVCYPKKQEIVLSYHLIHCGYDFIDYVILHELVHLVHPNHSKQFYYFIERYMPNYKAIIEYEKSAI